MIRSLEEEDGLEAIDKFAAKVVARLASKFFPPANDNPPPASEDAA